MIFGVGTDVLEIRRVEAIYQRFGSRFAQRVLMPDELRLFNLSKRPVRFLAMHFAAKEAVVKALGTGFSNGLWVRDTGIVADSLGKPEIIFSDRGKVVCQRLGVGKGYVSLSDEAGLIVALAVLERA
ncbi:MAG: holo-ACP synthase [Gammaproteobacteria bacterium]|nr:holo-ACP synthase [Gammaproteobacteria bacterium]